MKIVTPHIVTPESTGPAPAVALPAAGPVLEIIEKTVPMVVDLEPLKAEFHQEVDRLKEEIRALREAYEKLSQMKSEPATPLAAVPLGETLSSEAEPSKAEFSKEIQRLEEKIIQGNRDTFRLIEEVATLRESLEKLSKSPAKNLTPAPAAAPTFTPARVPAPAANPVSGVSTPLEPPVEKKAEPPFIAEPPKRKVAFLGKLWDYLNETAFEDPTPTQKNDRTN